MARLNLTAEDAGQKLILAYLEENASDSLAERINAGKKTMSGCWQYIRGRARALAKNQCACVPDSEVFGWAVHYFEEDAMNNETSAAKIQEERLRQNEEKERIRKEEAERKAKEKEKEKAAEALRKIEEAKRKEEEARKEKERQKEEERKKKASGGIDGQLSLFDLLGGE